MKSFICAIFASVLLVCILPCKSMPTSENSLDAYTLETLTGVYSINSTAAEILFTIKYGDALFVIQRDIFRPDTDESKGIVKLCDIDYAQEVFKKFGHLMTKLQVHYGSLHVKQIQIVSEYINKYASRSLIHLEVSYIVGDELQSLIRFPSVEYVKIIRDLEGQYDSLITDELNFNEMFPNVRHLTIEAIALSEPKALQQKFEHLEHLGLDITRVDQNWIRSVVRLNKQLKSIALHTSTWDLLKSINIAVPKLEKLTLNAFDESDEYFGAPIHFKQLKKLEINSYAGQVKKSHIVFYNLEEFECHHSIDKFYDVFIQNKHLKNVRIGQINSEQLLEIAERLPKLEVFQVFYHTRGNTATVVEFLQKAHNVQRVLFAQLDGEIRKTIRQQLDNDWEIVIEHQFETIVRKQ